MASDLETFIEAFADNAATCRGYCACGRTYFDSVSGGYDWNEGELDELRKDPNAIPMSTSVGYISLEGSTYIEECHCWHERARTIKRFLDAHAHKIADYLTKEKQRKQAAADSSPVVGG